MNVNSAHFTEDMLIAIQPELMEVRSPRTALSVDVDFSLAIHNRTGKYFIGRELLDMPNLPLGDVYYWRRRGDAPPAGLAGKIIGRLQHLQVVGRTLGGPLGLLPRRKSRRPLLHLDPFTVPTTVLQPRDAVLIHDLGPLTNPDLFPADVAKIYGHIYAELAKVGPHLVFVSRTVMEEFAALFPRASARSRRVIHPPLRAGASEGEPQAVAGINTPFLLTVGSIGHRKNQLRTIAAFERSGLAERGISYVMCGGPEPGYEDVQAAAARTPGVHLLPYVSDSELRWLYEQARGFVLLSLLEGFGMPVAEAAQRGLVPLISQGGVMQEVAGDGALYADPLDEGEMAQAMCTLAGLTATDREHRLGMLTSSLTRYDIAHFHDGWRDLMFDLIETS
jgi:glycosyltransferase involved in cell wall biosynthesis